MRPSFDVLVAGGGPAGLAAAIHAANAGLHVGLVEPRAGTIDKACGEGLMPPALRALDALGARPDAGYPFAGIRYLQGAWATEARCPGGAHGLGVRRLALHDGLRARAAAVGVTFVEGRIAAVEQDEQGIRAGGHRARWLIAADGLASPLRRRMGLDLPARAAPRIGLRRHFAVAPWSPYVEVWWGPSVEAYVTPVSPTEVGVAVLADARVGAGLEAERRFAHLLEQVPALRDRLSDPTSALRGAGPFERRVRRRVEGRVLFVGDSAGYLDPITGEGIRLGFDTAAAAVAALRDERPERYEADWWRITRSYRVLTGGLLRLAGQPRLRRLIVPGATLLPGVMRGILAVLSR